MKYKRWVRRLKIYAVIFFAIMICATLWFLLSNGGYDASKDISAKEESLCGGYFVVVNKWDSGKPSTVSYIVYANDTKVMYFITMNGYLFGITPLYNADGTVQVYQEE